MPRAFKFKDMKKLFLGLGFSLSIVLLFLSCKKQNMAESLEVKPMLLRSEQYYANLRAYKKSKHQIFFGWFGGTGAPGNPEVAGVLNNIPDSVDIVSLWGGVPPVGSYNHELMKKTRELKGTRFVHVFFPNYFDQFKFPKNKEGVKQFADTLIKMNKLWALDGIDIDYESHVLSIFSNDAYMELLVSELGKHMGPKSGTGKLLVIDSFVEGLPVEVIPYLDYYVVQAYSPQGGTVASLPYRFEQAPGMPFSKCIAGENFEALWKTGGLLTAYAAWNPPGETKGGVAAYHAEYEYGSSPDYKYVRQAIQLMNPAVK